MTPEEQAADSYGSYCVAIAALRARKVARDARLAEVIREVREDCINEWEREIPGFNAERARGRL